MKASSCAPSALPPTLSAAGPLADDAISQLASLTAQRDRELLDVSLAQGVLELLGALSVGVYRLVGADHEPKHWLCSGLARRGELTVSDPVWADMDALPSQERFPMRLEALETRAAVQAVLPGSPTVLREGRYICVMPLLAEIGMAGVLEVRSEQALTPESLRPIQTLLRVFANFQSLLESSQRDALTGLLNRQTFDTTFLKASMPSVPAGEPGGLPVDPERRHGAATGYWLGVIDIDHFKRVNDGYGHLIGDEVLVLVARIMRQTFRHSDRLYRFGGEEFVVLLRGGEEADALGAFERFRQLVEGYGFPQVGRVTVSVGFTEVQLQDTPNAAFSRADQAVYQAKHLGRNRVVGFEALVRAGLIGNGQPHVGDVELF
ncbi:MAG: GGDEF domain-containing protein [Aquabacterium sp.]